MLFKLLEPHFSFRFNDGMNTDQTKRQKKVWEKICEKAEKDPKTLTPLEAFQIGKLTERAINKAVESGKIAEIEQLQEIQNNIKFSL